MCEKECVAIAKSEMSEDITMRGLRFIRTHTREWAETTKRVENVTEEGPM